MHNQTSPAGKRILVTGGTTGIGRATVALIARDRARVLTFGRHQSELDEALANARGGRASVDGLTADAATGKASTRCSRSWTKSSAASTCSSRRR